MNIGNFGAGLATGAFIFLLSSIIYSLFSFYPKTNMFYVIIFGMFLLLAIGLFLKIKDFNEIKNILLACFVTIIILLITVIYFTTLSNLIFIIILGVSLLFLFLGATNILGD